MNTLKSNIYAVFLFGLIVFFLILGSAIPRHLELTGGCSSNLSPYLHTSDFSDKKITYCEDGDFNTSLIESEEFLGTSFLTFKYSGYPENRNVGVYLQTRLGEKHVIEIANVGEEWIDKSIDVPIELIGKELRIVAQDSSSQPFGWIGIGTVKSARISVRSWFWLQAISGILIFSTLFAIILTVSLRRFCLQDAVAISVVSLGLLGYAGFFFYLINRNLGHAFTLLIILSGCIGFRWINIEKNTLQFVRSICLTAPVLLFSILLLTIGFYPFDQVSNFSWQIAANRWLNLPMDNWLPKILADQVYQGMVQRPMVGDWLSSDRPPLQTGIYLLFYGLLPGSGVFYQAVATFLQGLWIPVVLIYLNQFKTNKARVSLVMLVTFSSLVLVHTIFVWPKIISAIYVFIFYLHFWKKDHYLLNAFIVGASGALSLLSHGGAIFALMGIVIFRLMLEVSQRFQEIRFQRLVLWTVIFVALMLPWSLYTKFIDPDASRLIKWHLAGFEAPTQLSTVEVIKQAFERISLQEWVTGRLYNLDQIYSGFLVWDFYKLSASSVGEVIRASSFFKMFYSMWFFSPIVGLVIWCLHGFKRIPKELSTLLGCSIFGTVVWIILMFQPGSAVVHQGSFFTWFGFFISSALLISFLSRKIYYVFFALNLIVAFSVYVLYGAGHLDLGYVSSVLALTIFFIFSLVIVDNRRDLAEWF